MEPQTCSGLHSTAMAVVGGALEIESVAGYGTRITLMPAGRLSLPETSARSL